MRMVDIEADHSLVGFVDVPPGRCVSLHQSAIVRSIPITQKPCCCLSPDLQLLKMLIDDHLGHVKHS